MASDVCICVDNRNAISLLVVPYGIFWGLLQVLDALIVAEGYRSRPTKSATTIGDHWTLASWVLIGSSAMLFVIRATTAVLVEVKAMRKGKLSYLFLYSGVVSISMAFEFLRVLYDVWLTKMLLSWNVRPLSEERDFNLQLIEIIANSVLFALDVSVVVSGSG